MDYNKIAEEALKTYLIKNDSIEVIRQFNGMVYKVTDDNRLYCLKLYISVNGKSEEKDEVNSELEWVTAIARDTDITVPESYKNIHGEYVTVVDGISCSLTKWLEGEQPPPNGNRFMWALFGDDEDINEHKEKEEAFNYIKVLGKLHRHSLEWKPPVGFKRRVNDIDEDDLQNIFAEIDARKFPDKYDFANKENIEILKQSAKKAIDRKKIFEKNNMTWGLAHGDYAFGNYIINNQEICPIDFGACGYNYYLADVVEAMHFVSPRKRQFFLDMYSKYYPLPDNYAGQLETLLISSELRYIRGCLKNTEPGKDGWVAADINTWAQGEFGYYLNDESFLFDKKAFFQFQ